jgi:hypothetical protein
VLSPVSPSEPAFVVEAASHHSWTHVFTEHDQPQVTAARAKIGAYVTQFLSKE